MRWRRCKGFTHIETLLTLAIMTIAAVSAAEFLRNGLRRFEALHSSLKDAADRGAAEAMLTRDLRSAFLSSSDARAVFVGRTDGAGLDRLDFAATGAEGRLREIGYRLELDAGTGRWNLWRREQPGLDADPLNGGASVLLCRDATALRLRYFDGGAWRESWGWDAGTRRPVAATRGLPLAVAVELSLNDGDRRGTRMSLCPLMAPLINRSLHA